MASLPLYRSFSNRPVFDRWSYSFTALAIVALLAGVTLVWRALRRARRPEQLPSNRRVVQRLFDASMLAWGGAYLLSAVGEHAQAARLLELNLFGSTQAVPAILEWLAMVGIAVAGLVMLRPIYSGRFGGIALAITASCILFILFEGGARVAALLFPKVQGFPTYASQIWMRNYVKLNSLGFRDTEHDTLAHDKRRLLVIGDSYAFGVGIEDPAARFGERLVQHLNQGNAEQWESENVSRGDTHTLDHLGFLRIGSRYQPDLIILLYVFNDIDYLWPVTERSVITDPGPSPWARFHPARLAFLNSFAFQQTFVRLRHLRFKRTAPPDPYADSAIVDQHLHDVKRLTDTARAVAPNVAVIPFDVAPLLGAAQRNRYNMFVRQARGLGIPIWPLEEAFGDRTYRSLIVNALDHHPNELAQDLAARAIADRIRGH
ncbi:MAG: SGNH/GDSL hydrolase family protein [Longimicrobiales bacterium]